MCFFQKTLKQFKKVENEFKTIAKIFLLGAPVHSTLLNTDNFVVGIFDGNRILLNAIQNHSTSFSSM